MTPPKENEFVAIRERLSTTEKGLIAVAGKVERISEILDTLDKLETRVGILENTNSYYKGAMRGAMFVAGAVGVILGIVISYWNIG